jgi:glycosyltransferase involved in cell wall biosynthesis
VTGLLVAPGYPADLSAALSTVVNDREAAARMGRMALDRARSFTASAVVGRVEELYQSLISGRPSPK